MKSHIAMGALLCSGALLAAEAHISIPRQFLGNWASSTAKCSSQDADDLRMHIAPNRMSFCESSGRVLAVATDGELELAVILELSGEGETWLEALQFRLSADRQTLTNVTGRQTIAVRVRCPAGKPA
jgi:hypothetical protein